MKRNKPRCRGRRRATIAFGRLLFALGAAILLGGGTVHAAASGMRVRGMGWLEDYKTEHTLKLLLGPQSGGATMSAGTIEDAALIVFSQLNHDGYLAATMTAQVTRADGTTAVFPLDARLEHSLPHPLAVRTVVFRVRTGPRFTLRQVKFTGLVSLREKDARGYFIGESAVLPLAGERIYSPGRLRRSIANLQEALQRSGHAEAVVTLSARQIERRSGKVRVVIKVQEGPVWRVKDVHFILPSGGESPPAELVVKRLGLPWSELWRQDTNAAVRRWYYQRGHPDVQVKLTPQAAPPENGEREVIVAATVTPGPLVRLGQVRFIGNVHTQEPVLRRLVHAKPGAPLNPIQFDNGEARIARLGVFNNIRLDYDPPGGATRDAVFHLSEGRRQEVDLLAGYGSYEQLRGGVEWRHYNLFGRGHADDLKAIQSMKSSQADYTYTVPELFGTSVDGSARLFGLRRQELSFVRTEYGATLSLLWPLRRLGADLTTGYTFRRLRTTSNELATSPTDLNQVNAASVDIGLTRDRRDNPLRPRHGYKLYALLSEASRRFGGQVDYQQLTLGASYHTSWGHGRWIHAGVTHGVVTTLGAPNDAQLPVNVRFFPGGDSSIRGYRDGEAAPRVANGQFIGAKTYLLLNLELEQALTSKWSVVAFCDALGTAVRLADYPFDERLYSVGLGLRYETLIGPVRLEYGRNLNPRPRDPSGTIQLSVGYPF